MQVFLDIIANLSANWQVYFSAIGAIVGGAIIIAAAVPGPEPERTLQKILDFITKFSKK